MKSKQIKTKCRTKKKDELKKNELQVGLIQMLFYRVLPFAHNFPFAIINSWCLLFPFPSRREKNFWFLGVSFSYTKHTHTPFVSSIVIPALSPGFTVSSAIELPNAFGNSLLFRLVNSILYAVHCDSNRFLGNAIRSNFHLAFRLILLFRKN